MKSGGLGRSEILKYLKTVVLRFWGYVPLNLLPGGGGCTDPQSSPEKEMLMKGVPLPWARIMFLPGQGDHVGIMIGLQMIKGDNILLPMGFVSQFMSLIFEKAVSSGTLGTVR